MTARPLPAEKFVRRTLLSPDEYRKNFRQIDNEIIAAVTSTEADAVTPLMSKVYLRLVNAPERYWEREGVLRFAGEEMESGWTTAWEQLVSLVGVASATARKALSWMHGEGLIGYFAGKNGVGIRIFLNRAASSIGRRPSRQQKNLRLVPASTEQPRTSAGDTPFNDSFADLEVLETDLSPHAPKNGAEQARLVKTSLNLQPPSVEHFSQGTSLESRKQSPPPLRTEITVDEIIARLGRELEPAIESAARRAAAREHEHTREWLEGRGLPKAARVAQREAYNVLRRYGLIDTHARVSVAGATVGQNADANVGSSAEAKPLSPEELRELAETCLAMLEVHGQAIDVTLSELSTEAGGSLPADDVPKVRELADAMAREGVGQTREI